VVHYRPWTIVSKAVLHEGLEFINGAQDFLGRVHRTWPGSRLYFAAMVGAIFDDPNRRDVLVGCLSKRMVRMNRTRHRSLIAAALVFVSAQCFAAAPRPAAGWTLHYLPTKIVNGSPVAVRVTTPEPVSELTGKWLGHELAFNFDQRTKTWIALAGASLETKPGSYPIELQSRTSTGRALSFKKGITVQRKRYPRVVLKVPGRYTAPSTEEQREIEKDKKTKESAFKTLSPEREWRGSFDPPVNAQISEVFGVQRVFNGSVKATHQGLDFRVPAGTPVAAVNSGKVILAQPLFFEGDCVVVDHGQGLLTLYLHLSKFLVKEGDEVRKGQQVGLSGGTGRATGPHLHLAVRWQGEYLNPQILLSLQLPGS
jgi:murein DD-endopeptidase MepM/ murein hydrolase activator NlpD